MDITIQPISESTEFYKETIDLLYRKYKEEIERFPYLAPIHRSAFQSDIDRLFTQSKVTVGIENGRVSGVILYFSREECGEKYIEIPAYGYAALSENADKIIGELFRYTAKNEVIAGKTNFSVRIYAHDAPVRQLFSFMQFGTMAETCIRKSCADHERLTQYPIKNLSKREISENWSRIWALIKCLIDHLKESPVFYKGDGFTEELYRAFYLNDNTTLFAAYNERGDMVGIIESNREKNSFIGANGTSVNIGEAYLLPEYRRCGLAQDLFYFAEKFVRGQGADFLWVEHGTANPNARGFWNKYFKTYQYEMTRRVFL